MSAKPKVLRNTQKRTRRILKHKPVDAKKTQEYEALLEKVRKLEAKRAKIEKEIEKKLEPVRISLGINKLEEKIFDIDEEIDKICGDKERFEALVIQLINDGIDVRDFILQVVSKRFTVSYKAICEAVFNGRPHDFEQYKEQYGSRKEQFILKYKGEEVSRRQVANLSSTTSLETE